MNTSRLEVRKTWVWSTCDLKEPPNGTTGKGEENRERENLRLHRKGSCPMLIPQQQGVFPGTEAWKVRLSFPALSSYTEFNNFVTCYSWNRIIYLWFFLLFISKTERFSFALDTKVTSVFHQLSSRSGEHTAGATCGKKRSFRIQP